MIAAAECTPLIPVCDLCGHPDAREVQSLILPDHPIPFRLWQCRRCAGVFNYPLLRGDQIRGQYDGEYYVFKESPARRWARATQVYIEHLLPLESRVEARRLLEVGCAGGELLALSRERGWDVTGVEISQEAAASARQEHGLHVLAGTLEEHAASLGSFDVAIANDVIEHVPSPRLFLHTLHRVVRPGGLLCLETPNWDSRWRRLGGASWLGINRFHIFLFNASSLLRLMRDCGWTDCLAGSSTNLAYTSWASRPEITRWIKHLPAGLRWRAEQWADRLTPASPALTLHRDPPNCLTQALDRIAALHTADHRADRSLSGDNLTVIGRA